MTDQPRPPDQRSYRAAGLVGLPVTSSRSPLIHRHWLDRYGLAGDYVLMPVQAGALEPALRGLAALGLAGCNVTMPHKEEAARLVDRLDPTARRIGAVNLVVADAGGVLTGHNTDVYGFVQNLLDVRPAWDALAGPAVVLGAGGSCRSVIVGLLDQGVTAIRLANRTRARAEALAAGFGGRVTVLDWPARHDALPGAALLVNTTNQGMSGHPPLDLALDALPRTALVCDIVYNPLSTPLLDDARSRGHPTVNGLGMLLHQARPAFAAWWGVDPEVTPALRRAVEATIGA